MSIGIIGTELVYSRPPGRKYGSGIVPKDQFERLEQERKRFQIKTIWSYDADPITGEQRPAFTPIEGGRLEMIESRGIRHGDRYQATFEVREVRRQGGTQRQMWLVDVVPLRSDNE